MDTTLAPVAVANSTVAQESIPRNGIVVARDVMVAMRDGVRLATDIYRPAVDGEPVTGRFPTILGRTSYDKTDPTMWVRPVADFFRATRVRRGPPGPAWPPEVGRHRPYFQSCNPTEGPDGYDTVEWVAAQPWSNRRVGAAGSSHGSIVQQVMALYLGVSLLLNHRLPAARRRHSPTTRRRGRTSWSFRRRRSTRRSRSPVRSWSSCGCHPRHRTLTSR